MAGKRKSTLRVVHPDCAGIDIGGTCHWVAIDPARSAQPVRRFGVFTDELEALAAWLAEHEVLVVAMEATGVYWIPAYELLQSRGFRVHLVNARATKQVSGRKSDVLDCQWIWQLMSYGLLKGAFRPAEPVCRLRALVRQRALKVQDQARAVLHLHKALAQMNVQLTNAVSDITGKTGMAIVRAIVAGERDGARLATLRDRRLRADEATLARSLRGNWRDEHLFALMQALAQYDFLAGQIVACDEQITAAMAPMVRCSLEPPTPAKPLRGKHRSTALDTQLRHTLYQILGVDLTAIPTVAVETALVTTAEIGPDLSAFPSSEHFCSWLNLAPPTRITGGKPIRGRTPRVHNRAGQAIRQAAANARRSDSFIGAAHRARLSRMDKPSAIKATAHQIARLIYAMLTKGQPYVERGIAAFEEIHHDRQVRALQRRAHRLGLQLVETQPEKSAA